MRETWYVLENGDNADPFDVAPGAGGRLMHKSGIAVAMRAPDVPHTRGVDATEERAKAVRNGAMSVSDARSAEGLSPIPAKSREIKAAGNSKKYQTR